MNSKIRNIALFVSTVFVLLSCAGESKTTPNKDKAEEIFSELGLNMTTAVNIFLRTAIREHGIPFELKLDIPNDITAAAIEEGRKIMSDPNTPRYSSMDALREALEV